MQTQRRHPWCGEANVDQVGAHRVSHVITALQAPLAGRYQPPIGASHVQSDGSIAKLDRIDGCYRIKQGATRHQVCVSLQCCSCMTCWPRQLEWSEMRCRRMTCRSDNVDGRDGGPKMRTTDSETSTKVVDGFQSRRSRRPQGM